MKRSTATDEVLEHVLLDNIIIAHGATWNAHAQYVEPGTCISQSKRLPVLAASVCNVFKAERDMAGNAAALSSQEHHQVVHLVHEARQVRPVLYIQAACHASSSLQLQNIRVQTAV
jgi:hypothetical protein